MRSRDRRADRAPGVDSAGAATWTGVDTDRYVSQMTSSRSSASAARASGPLDDDPAELHLRQPADFDRPPSDERQRARVRRASDAASGAGPSG